MHPFFYLEIANQHRDELIADVQRHRRRRIRRRRPDNVHDLTIRTVRGVVSRASSGAVDAAA